MLWFLVGLLAGGTLGALAVCLCMAAGSADRAEERRIPGSGEGPEG